jgi:hypothetical protein
MDRVSSEWVPFGLSEADAERYRVLVDGVPPELLEPIIAWFRHILAGGDYNRVRNDRTRHLQMLTGVRMGVPEEVYASWETYTALLREMNEDALLRVVDAALSSEWYGTSTRALDEALRLCRSKWMVGRRMDKPGLVAREPEGVQDVVEATIHSAGSAGQILARAWGKVHALTPDDPGAYADAVRAVETAAQPLIEPYNREATLGSIASVMRNQGDWRLPLREHQHVSTAEMLVALCRSLYRGHVDRHGSDDYRDVTHEEARAGVVLAASLVAWFASGAVERRPQ